MSGPRSSLWELVGLGGEFGSIRNEIDRTLNPVEWRGDQPDVGTVTRVRLDRTLLGIPIGIVCGVAEEMSVRAASAGWLGNCDPTAPTLTIDLRPSETRAGGNSLEFTVSASELVLRGGGVSAVASAAERMALCKLSPDWFARPADLLTRVLEPLALFMATKHGRIPLHASAIQVGDLAILFAGPSGAGKSSLAFAAHEAGLTVLSEDTVYVRSQPELEIWGWEGPIHLLPGDACPTAPIRIRNGRAKHAISITNAASEEPPGSAVLCILERQGRPSLTRLTGRSAIELLSPLEPGFDLLAPEIHALHRQLCRNGAWLLGLSESPSEAIALVLENLDRFQEEADKLQRAEG